MNTMHRVLVTATLAAFAALALPADAQYYDANGNMKTIATSAVRATVQASGAQTVGGSSAAAVVGNFREYLLLVNVTAVSGTASPTLTLFVDTSSDGGTTWFQIATATAITATGTSVIALGAGSSATPVLFGDTIRLRWTISGTTPSFTFSVVGIGK